MIQFHPHRNYSVELEQRESFLVFAMESNQVVIGSVH